ncbi:MAG: VWA domain-containing protein [Acidobacteriota bacterium]|nr:VWA domain-containing protein [Acidobacteriota bacterium]
MNGLTRISLALTLSCGASLSVFTQTRTDSDRQEDTRVVVDSAEVLLDTIVRDKRGRVVRNLTETDFEVFEDGVRQELRAARFVTRETTQDSAGNQPRLPASSLTKTADDSVAGVSALALVFDRLRPESRNNARQAAIVYANKNLTAKDFVGVFAVDQSLKTVQPFTNDTQLVRQAVDRAGSMNSSTYNLASETNRVASRGTTTEVAFGGQAGIGREGPVVTSAAAAPGPGGEAGIVAAIVATMTRRSLEIFERLEREQQGHATSNSLLAVIESLRAIPGRKAVIFFSDGLAIPPAVETHFRAVINAANRANVSVYAVDAAGLRAESATAETRRQINALSAKLSDRANSSGEDTSGQPLTRDLERNEDLLRFNPHSGLGQLADETGGFLLRDTNNLNDGLRRIDEDMGAYYLLSYTPKDGNYDGRFRRVEVKPKRAGLSVQSRKGYYAITGSFASPVLAYETPALAIATSGRRPTDLVVRAAALSFPEANRPGLVPIVVEVPTRFVTFSGDEAKKQYSTDFSIVVLIKDAKGQVVRKLSNRYVLGGALDKLTATRQSDVLFYREAEFDPGQYTIETVVHDALGNKAGVSTSRLEVPERGDEQTRLSSVVIIKRAERIGAAEQKINSPFHFGDVLLYPNLGEPLSKQSAKQLAFFCVVHFPKSAGVSSGTTAPQVTVEVRQNGRTLGSTASPLPSPDANNRVQYASALPLEKFQPGTYQLTVTVKSAQNDVSRSTQFIVEP